MTIDRTGSWWVGTEPSDLDDFLAEYLSRRGASLGSIVHAACASCVGNTFAVKVDDGEGCAQRTCVLCGVASLMFDSEDTVEGADLGDAACPCGNETFNVAGAFELREDGEVRWVYLGLRCTADGVLGCYADWGIDYSPSAHLTARV